MAKLFKWFYHREYTYKKLNPKYSFALMILKLVLKEKYQNEGHFVYLLYIQKK